MVSNLLKSILILSILVLSINTNAQKKSYFEVDGGYTVIGNNAQAGYGINVGAGYTLFNIVVPTIGYQFHSLSSQSDHYSSDAKLDIAYFAVKVNALKFKWFSFNVGPMVFRRIWKQDYTVNDGYILHKDGLTMNEDHTYSYYKPNFGYGGVAGFKFDLYKQFGAKLDASYQIDFDHKDSMLFGSGGIYFNF
ncbi:MAG: hypothetical protein J5I59_09340 [Saprospiraceae bacterium]|nr:hypothetical protein [Saprospiraceae bacterium]